MIACAINERLQRELDYVQEEVRVLREAVEAAPGSERIAFTADQRRRLTVAGKELTPDERQKCCQIVKPETLPAWFRQLGAKKYDGWRAKLGRPRKATTFIFFSEQLLRCVVKEFKRLALVLFGLPSS
jgi:hypothetical protein